MHRKLQALEASGKESSEQLFSMEQQLHRIDNLDKKLAAVTNKLDFTRDQIKKSNVTRQHISSDMKEMKTYTAQPFAAMNQRLFSDMESQDKISTTMLYLREHFEKMSSFMERLAEKKWNLIRKSPQVHPLHK